MPPPAIRARSARGGGRRHNDPVQASSRLAGMTPREIHESRNNRPSSVPPTNRNLQNTRGEFENFNQTTPINHPNASEDLDPAPSGLSKEDLQNYKKRLTSFGDEMYDVFESESSRGEELWIDFISTCRPHSIDAWPKGLTYKWCKLLRSRDIHLDNGRETPRTEALKSLLFRKEHIPVIRQLDSKENAPQFFSTELRHPTSPQLKHQTFRGGNHSRIADIAVNKTAILSKSNASKPDLKEMIAESGSDDDSPEDDYISRAENIGSNKEMSSRDQQRPYNRTQGPQYGAGMGIQGLMKSFAEKKTFSGSWEEDLDSTISIYEVMCEMCQANDGDRLKGIPVMLTGDALLYYSSNVKESTTCEEALDKLRKWYNNSDNRARILIKWQSIRLTEEMMKNPEASQVEVFQKFVAKLMSLQKQLDPSYHDDKYLRDRLMTAVDIHSIQVAIRDRVPRTAQQLVNSIVKRLSEQPRTAGSAPTSDIAHYNEAMYTLEQHYGEEARRSIRPFGNRGPSTSSGTRYSPKYDHQRKLCPSWMRGIKGCFVCGKVHLARQRHGRKEIKDAIELLKTKHPSALLTVEDLAAVYEMIELTENSEEEETEDEVKWAEEEFEENHSVVLIASAEAKNIAQHFAMSAFLHGRGLDAQIIEPSLATDDIGNDEDTAFEELRIDTCANRTSVIGLSQYRAYCRNFNLLRCIRPSGNRTIKGIGGTQKSIGIILMQIPFTRLNAIIDVSFLVLDKDIPTLLSMKDMLENGLDISIQGQYVS